MSKHLCEISSCVGCFSCYQKCTTKAIEIIEIDGFKYPKIIDSKCIDCGMCDKVCPILHNITSSKFDKNVYAIYSKDDNIRSFSASGGIFYELAQEFILSGGCVCGVVWAGNMQCKHIIVDNLSELKLLQGSKYVQSDTTDIFTTILDLLKNKKRVLFSGTPCQVSALISFIKTEQLLNNLYTIEVICQGVSSQNYFDKYINYLQDKYKKQIVDVRFRTKIRGWRTFGTYVKFADNTSKYLYQEDNFFFKTYLMSYGMRPSCYKCQYKSLSSVSDLSLADFWRIGSKIPYNISFKSKHLGVSAVLVNTHKGEFLLDSVKNNVIIERRTFDEFSSNGGLRCATQPITNQLFMQCLKKLNVKQINKNFIKLNVIYKSTNWIKYVLGYKNIDIIKSILKIR